MVAFELWETRSANLMGSFDSEGQALAALVEAIHRHGADYADTLVLVREGECGSSTTVAAGAELAARAMTAYSKHQAISA